MTKQLTYYVNKAVTEKETKEQRRIEFGLWLGGIIASTGLKQNRIAKEAEIHEVSFSRILKGEYGLKRETAIRIIDAINNLKGQEIVDKTDGLNMLGYSSNEEDVERVELEAMYRKRKNLSPARREAFARILDMVDRELDRLHEEELKDASKSAT